MSAYGIALADVVHEESLPCSLEYNDDSLQEINGRIDTLMAKCKEALSEKGFTEKFIKYEVYLNLRYARTDFSMMVSCADKVHCDANNYRDIFSEQYKREFGFNIPEREILVDDVRIRGIGFTSDTFLPKSVKEDASNEEPKITSHTQCYFENVGYVQTPIYFFDDLKYSKPIHGPAILIESNSTILVEPFCTANLTKQGNVLIDIENGSSISLGVDLDPIYLSLFSHMFMGIAEQMGSVLRQTSISTNIKERLDFSCAIFGPNGFLVSNAPHIPVHLGSMGKVVQYLSQNIPNMEPGDVYLTNHPCEGGKLLCKRLNLSLSKGTLIVILLNINQRYTFA